MSYSYTDPEQTGIVFKDGQLSKYFPADPANRDYAEFLASGAEAAPYVAPPEPEPLTAEQKLANSGLTVDELKTLLGI